MNFLLIIREQTSPIGEKTSPSSASATFCEPERILKAYGYDVLASSVERDIRRKIREADAVVLQMPIPGIRVWANLTAKLKAVPLMWWCSEMTAVSSLASSKNEGEGEDDIPVDGILTPSMSANELHWSLHLGAKHFLERRQWMEERTQLVSRLEERKWIDHAKGILCEINRISEAEAYEVLRKRAMNERKRIVDISALIVKAHQQLKT